MSYYLAAQTCNTLSNFTHIIDAAGAALPIQYEYLLSFIAWVYPDVPEFVHSSEIPSITFFIMIFTTKPHNSQQPLAYTEIIKYLNLELNNDCFHFKL